MKNKNWRPKDWKNPHKNDDDIEHRCPVMETSYSNPIRDANIYEAGADAILEALREGSGFRCSVMNITPVYGGSTTSPLEFMVHTQSVVEEKDGATHISLPSFNFPEYQTYPPRKGHLVFIPDEDML